MKNKLPELSWSKESSFSTNVLVLMINEIIYFFYLKYLKYTKFIFNYYLTSYKGIRISNIKLAETFFIAFNLIDEIKMDKIIFWNIKLYKVHELYC
jgi:hypothetical protein